MFGGNCRRTSLSPFDGGLRFQRAMPSDADPVCHHFDTRYVTAFSFNASSVCSSGNCLIQKLPLITQEGVVVTASLTSLSNNDSLPLRHTIRMFDIENMEAIREDLVYQLPKSNMKFLLNNGLSVTSSGVITSTGMYVNQIPYYIQDPHNVTYFQYYTLILASDVTRLGTLSTQRWTFNSTSSTCTVGLTSDQSDPIIHCGGQGIYRLNQKDGSVRWHHKDKRDLAYNYLPASHDGLVYALSNCTLMALNETNGYVVGNTSVPNCLGANETDDPLFGFDQSSLLVLPLTGQVVLQTRASITAFNATYQVSIPTPSAFSLLGAGPVGIGLASNKTLQQVQDKGFQFLDLFNMTFSYGHSGTTLDPVYNMPALLPNSTSVFLSYVQGFTSLHLCRKIKGDELSPVVCCDVPPNQDGKTEYMLTQGRSQVAVSPNHGLWYFKANRSSVALARAQMVHSDGKNRLWLPLAITGGALLCCGALGLSAALVVAIMMTRVLSGRPGGGGGLPPRESSTFSSYMALPGGPEGMSLRGIARGEQWLIDREDVRLLRVVGAGARGTVWLGRWREIDVAVKLLKIRSSSPKEVRCQIQTFSREMELLSRLRHPNIVTFLGGVVDPPAMEYAIVLQYHECGSLFEYIGDPSTSSFGAEEALGFVLDIARGMSFLHGRDPPVLHRDLKSPNLLVTNREGRKGVAITDFGLSRFIVDLDTTLTEGMGTIVWMAPELLKSEPYDERVDVYSFGIVLWEILTRERPFGDMNKFLIASNVIEGHRPTIPPHMRMLESVELMSRCWASNPMDRPTFDDILECVIQWTPEAMMTTPPPVMDDEGDFLH